MAPTEVYMEAFKIDTATRDNILNNNLRETGSVKILPIRQTLGFREITSRGPRPKFVSMAVDNLYSAIDKLSREVLPSQTIKDLRLAWRSGTLLDDEIESLMKAYGDEIWGAALRKRDANNPGSHLLAVGEGEGFYTTDLSYYNLKHRAYIKLQLEHMAYAKAINYYKNHNRVPKPDSKSATSAKETAPTERAASAKRTILATKNESSKTRPSLIVVFSLPSTKLLMFPQDAKTQEHYVQDDLPNKYELQSRNQSLPKIVGLSGAQDRAEYAQQRRRRSRPLIVESDEEDNEDYPLPKKRLRVKKTSERRHVLRYTRKATRRVATLVVNKIRNNIDTDRDSILSAPPEVILEDIPERLSVPENQDSINSERTQPHKKSSKDRPVVENEDEDISPPKDMSLEREKRTAPAELDLEGLRLDLHMLLVGELSSGAQSLSKDPEKLWETSQEINLALKVVWAADKNEFERTMGADTYRMVDRAVNEWLVWRDMTRKLGSVAGIHPSQGPLPLLTGDQWAEKFGGKHEFQVMDLRLATYRRLLHSPSSKASKEESAELLATAFSFVIKYSLGVASFISFYKENILASNEKLFSWPLDFAPRE